MVFYLKEQVSCERCRRSTWMKTVNFRATCFSTIIPRVKRKNGALFDSSFWAIVRHLIFKLAVCGFWLHKNSIVDKRITSQKYRLDVSCVLADMTLNPVRILFFLLQIISERCHGSIFFYCFLTLEVHSKTFIRTQQKINFKAICLISFWIFSSWFVSLLPAALTRSSWTP